MTSLLAVFLAALAFAATLFGSNNQRNLLILCAGVASVLVASAFPTIAALLAVLGGGVLIGGAAARRESILSVALGVALIVSSAIMGELSAAETAMAPLRAAATLLAGAGCGWLVQSWQPRASRWMIPVVIVTLLVLGLGLFGAYDIQSGMALLPITTDLGTKALLVFRGSNAVEAYPWMVPVPYSVISITVILALIPVGTFLSLRGRESVGRGRESVGKNQPASPVGSVFSVLVGVLLLATAFLVWGKAPEILLSTPDVVLLEQFRPASVASDWELVLRPLAESYRVDCFAILPILFAGLFVTLSGLLVGLRKRNVGSWTSPVSLWPASIAFTLSAMLFAAFQVDVAADTWAFAGGATTMLAASLCAAGLELQLGLSRHTRSRYAAIATLGGVVAWIVYWSVTI